MMTGAALLGVRLGRLGRQPLVFTTGAAPA